MKDIITTLLFDVDGTILDTREFILQATEHALLKHKFTVPERTKIADLVGKPFDEYYTLLTGSTDPVLLKTIQDTHRQYQLSNMHLSSLFPGTIETLNALKERGYKMAAVTTRSKKTSLETLNRAGLNSIFKIVISGEDASEVKPHPAPLLKALEILESTFSEAAMIGDSDLDVQAGKNAGTATVRATYGFHANNLENPKPDFVIQDIRELTSIFE